MVEVEIKGLGWDAFVKNDWTSWAKENGLILSDQKISVVKHHSKSLKSHYAVGRLKIDKVTARNPWRDWFEKKTGPENLLTIIEHKAIFENKRPERAKSFAERKIDKSSVLEDRYKNSLRVPEDLWSKNMNFFWMERELLIPEKNKKRKVVVERILNPMGTCIRITTIGLPGKGIPPSVMQEDWISRGVWSVSFKAELEGDEWVRIKYPALLKTSRPWSEIINASVAQSY